MLRKFTPRDQIEAVLSLGADLTEVYPPSNSRRPGEALCFEVKYAFADIHSRHTERTGARRCGLIQSRKKMTGFRASAEHSKRKSQTGRIFLRRPKNRNAQTTSSPWKTAVARGQYYGSFCRFRGELGSVEGRNVVATVEHSEVIEVYATALLVGLFVLVWN